MLFPVLAAHICLSRMHIEKDARAGIFFYIGSSLLNNRERFFQLISDLPFLFDVGATLSHHRYNFSALSNRILSMISFALLTERYPSSIFSVRTLHSEKRNARREP